MYCCKYVSKPKRKGTRTALYEVIEDMERKDASAKDNYGDDYEESKLGGKIHRAFMAEVGGKIHRAFTPTNARDIFVHVRKSKCICTRKC